MPSHADPSLNTRLLDEPVEAGTRDGILWNDDDNVCVIVLKPIGQRAVNGIYSSYDPNFPEELNGVVPRGLYEKDMERFNHRLQDYWPCPFCFGFGYCCAICTLGMSFYCPSMCVSSAAKFATEYFEQQANNRAEYFDSQLKFRLVRSCCSSWVEVSYRRCDDRNEKSKITHGNIKLEGTNCADEGTNGTGSLGVLNVTEFTGNAKHVSVLEGQ